MPGKRAPSPQSPSARPSGLGFATDAVRSACQSRHLVPRGVSSLTGTVPVPEQHHRGCPVGGHSAGTEHPRTERATMNARTFVERTRSSSGTETSSVYSSRIVGRITLERLVLAVLRWMRKHRSSAGGRPWLRAPGGLGRRGARIVWTVRGGRDAVHRVDRQVARTTASEFGSERSGVRFAVPHSPFKGRSSHE